MIGERINPCGSNADLISLQGSNCEIVRQDANAIQVGMTYPIANTLVIEISTAIFASDFSQGRDKFGKR